MYKIIFIKNSLQFSNLKFKIIFSFLLTSYALHLTSSSTHASSISLSISPPLIQIETLPPLNTERPITIKNEGKDSLAIQILLQPFKASTSHNGELEYLSIKDTTPHPDKDILKKIRLTDKVKPIEEFELAPHQPKNLQLEIKIPKKEPQADYYYSIIFLASNIAEKETTQNTALNHNSVQPQQTKKTLNISTTQAGIATNLLLSIGSRVEPKAYIEEFTSPFFLQSGPVPFTLKIKNTGSQIIKPRGIILVRNLFGQTVGRIELPGMNILANSERYLSNNAENSPISQNTIKKEPVKLNWQESILLGPYTANLEISMSDKGPVYSRKTHFIAAPFQTIIFTVTIISIVISIYLQTRKKLKQVK